MPTLLSLLRKIDRLVESINDEREAIRLTENAVALWDREENPFKKLIYKYIMDRLIDRLELLQGALSLVNLRNVRI